MPPVLLLTFDLTTSASAVPLHSLGARYGFLALHWVVTERFMHHPPAPKAPQDLVRVTGVLQVTDPEAFREALTRRIGRHTYARHPIPTIGALYVAAVGERTLMGLEPGAQVGAVKRELPRPAALPATPVPVTTYLGAR